VRLALAAFAVCACVAHTSGEKGGVRPVKLPPAALEEAFEPRRFALVVGISEFDDEQWRDLRYAVKDARDFAAALEAKEKGGFNKVVLLTAAEETGRDRILGALEDLSRQATRPDDVVVVYFSAHGTLARDAKGELRRYLVSRDARFRDVANTALGIDAIKARLDRFGSRRRLLVLAACHSGSGKSLLPEELSRELEGIKSDFYARPLEEVSRAAIVLSASDWGETAREDDQLQNDIYTHFLLDGLGGDADRNGDGAVSAYEAHDHARRRTFVFTAGRQRPSAEILEVGADPILLAGHIQRTGNPELYSYNPRFDGFALKVDGEVRTELPGGTAVPAGTRKVELTKGDEILFSRSVSLDPGARLELEALLRSASPRRTLFLTGGAFGFADRTSRREILPTSVLAGLSLRWDDVPLNDFSLWLDVGASAGAQRLHLDPGGEIPFRFVHLNAGVGTPYARRFGRFRLFGGPRVAGVWIRRSFRLQAFTGSDAYFTVSPGLMGGMSWALSDWLELSAQGNLMLTYVVVDGRGQAIGFAGGWAGVGYRF
jgi:uncharacterized caspase-like protein